MTHNENGAVSPSTLWDAAKAVIRGKLMMWSAQKKKKKERQIKDLIEKLKSLESKHMDYNDTSILNDIMETKRTLNNLYENQVEKRAKLIKQNFYENGPKSKKLLAWRIRKQQAERFIHKVRDPRTNEMYHNLEDIQNTFGMYHTKLYAQPRTTESAVISFLTSLDLPSIGTEQNKITQEITDDEINEAI